VPKRGFTGFGVMLALLLPVLGASVPASGNGAERGAERGAESGGAGAGTGGGAGGGAGADLVRTYCAGCHRERAGGFERISAIRKTPEGWVMTLFRMRQVHGVALPQPVHDAIVQYLADAQGLAPAESAAARFALEQRPNVPDIDLGPEMGIMCGRCHSLARVALQRRDEAEWRKLTHTHVGQWPSTEYQQSGRDRHWWDIASGPLPARLAALYPFTTPEWTDWRARAPADLSGDWVVVGHVPGGRDFFGTERIERRADGRYAASYRLSDLEGTAQSGESTAIVYTGYEWRGSARFGERARREVYQVTDGGNRLEGRWFDPDHAEEGGEWTAVRDRGPPQILAVWPKAIRAGAARAVTIVGIGLTPAAVFGPQIVASEQRLADHVLRAEVRVAADAPPGARTVSIGPASASLAIYRQIDALKVAPGYAIARLGGGRVDPVSAQFEALAETRLPDGRMLALGPVEAIWSSKPFNEQAARSEDEKFAGYIDRRGRFLPSVAGPNPAREFSGDNVGDLSIVATAHDGGREIAASSHLIVTVQRWNTPPIY